MMAPRSDAAGPRTIATRLVQFALSAAVLWALSRRVDPQRFQEIRATSSVGWLGIALLMRVGSTVLHEVRLWLALLPPRPPAGKVIGIGLLAGMINLVLPARAGDLVALGLLRRECGVPTGRAMAAVGLVSFVEMAVFAVFLLGALLAGAQRWEALLGAEGHAHALQVTTLATLGAVAVAVILALLARRRAPPPGAVGPVALLREALGAAGSSLGAAGWLAWQLSLSAVQVGLMVASVVALFPALSMTVALPWLAAAGVLAGASLAAVALPPSFGAGPAAVAVALLAPLGIDEAGALAFAAGFWLITSVPTALLGLPVLWRRGR